ncbi:MAG: WbqC family protein [Bacteroidales bacterium]|nr:WbqC family protein [Bacteroidales bacterium]
MRPVLLTSAYLAPVQYFTKLYAAPYVVEERCDHYVKQTYRNRCVIAGPDGSLPLTIPIEHGDVLKPATRDIRISDHGNWRHLHWTALVSAYDNSPYFAYYADDFAPFYERPYKYLVDFNEGLRALICDLLDLHPDVRPTSAYADAAALGVDDLRETIRPKTGYAADVHFSPAPYYQVFRERHGFLPNLSMADLLFNMGPESRLILKKSVVEE